MDWKEEMKMAMLMMKSACQKNPSLYGCWDCPFYDYCDDCLYAPEDWNLESED